MYSWLYFYKKRIPNQDFFIPIFTSKLIKSRQSFDRVKLINFTENYETQKIIHDKQNK